jgi:hypothetical protein
MLDELIPGVHQSHHIGGNGQADDRARRMNAIDHKPGALANIRVDSLPRALRKGLLEAACRTGCGDRLKCIQASPAWVGLPKISMNPIEQVSVVGIRRFR